MSMGAVALAISFLGGTIAAGQSATEHNIERVLNTHSETPQELTELATVIRVVTDIRDLSADAGQKSLALRGTAGQVAAAEWLISELDDPAKQPPRAEQIAGSAAGEYRLPEVDDGVVRVFRLSETTTKQALVEIATMIRTMVDIRRLFTFSARRAIVARGTAGQIELAEWVVSELVGAGSRPRVQQTQGPTLHEYRVPDIGDETVRIFRLARAGTTHDAVDIATALRVTADIRKLFVYSEGRALGVRGTASQLALSDWLVSELDDVEKRPRTSPGQGPVSHEYRVSNDGTEVVRVFFLTHTTTDAGLREIGTAIRVTANIPKLYTCIAPNAVAARGTAAQMAMAEQLIRERDRPR